MKKYALIALFGIAIMFGGCVPFGVAIKNSFNANEVLNQSITVSEKMLTSIINVSIQHYIIPAIKLHLSTTEINRNRDDDFGDEYEAKYRFPIKVIITNQHDNKLYEYSGKLEWNQGTKSIDLDNVTSRDGEVIVKIDLDKIKIPAPGKIKVSVLLEADRYYYAKIHSANLIIYDNVQTHTSNILTGIAIIIIGILVFILGLVMLILKQSKTPSISSTAAKDTINTGNSINTGNPMKTENNDNQENLKNIDKQDLATKSNRSSINSTAMFCHLSTFAGIIIPFGGILGPLIVWQIKKDEDPFINRHGIAAMNFHLSMMIYYFVSFLLAFVIIGFFFLAVLAITELVLVILASIKASNGEEYKYPLAIPFIKVKE